MKAVVRGLVLLFLFTFWSCSASPVWDENGYVVFCPCMGRFGNQAEHYLEAMGFTKDLNRTLILAPWRTYVRQRNVPFKEWFKPEAVSLYHKAITMEDFMFYFAEEKWKERIGYCYKPYRPDVGEDCGMKDGVPFRPFWNELGINFIRSEITTLTYDTRHPEVKRQWLEKYPGSEHPVLALKGAPASFPMKKRNRALQVYLVWSDNITRIGDEYRSNIMKNEDYIGVHLRMGQDWHTACQHGVGVRSFMESMQCLEEDPEESKVTEDICYPRHEDLVLDVKHMTEVTGIKAVYLASDVQPVQILDDLKKELGSEVKIFSMNPDIPQIDLYMLGKSNHFIGNCVSSFTAFVKRERDVAGLPSSFWGRIRPAAKDEL